MSYPQTKCTEERLRNRSTHHCLDKNPNRVTGGLKGQGVDPLLW